LVIKTGIGIVSGSIFFFIPIGVVSLTSTLLAGAIIFNVAQGISDFECNNLVSKVTMERVSQEKNIGFLETLPEKTKSTLIYYGQLPDEQIQCPQYLSKVDL
jgi:hypothetical protein